MTPQILVRTLAATLLALPVLASAQQAFTTHTLNMRAGPAPDFPVVAVLPQGSSVMIQGCISDFSWCDVQLPDNGRGWVYAEYLSHPYQGSYVPVRNMGSSIGIPILAFGLAAYWANHYRDRSWYNNQSQWDHYWPRPPHGHPPPLRPPQVRPPHIGHPPPPLRPPQVRPPPVRPPHIGHPPPRPRPPMDVRPPQRPQPPIDVRPPQRPHPGDRPPAVNRPGSGGDNQGGGRQGDGGGHRQR